MDTTLPDQKPFQILAVLHDGDDFRLIQQLLREAYPGGLNLVWEADRGRGLDVARKGTFDAILLEDRSGDKSIHTFLREARRKGLITPMLVITGRSDISASTDLLDAGATDTLPRDKVSAFVLERALHSAIVHRRTIDLAYESAARFQRIFESASEVILIHNSQHILEVNPAGALLFGYGTVEMPALPLASLFPPDQLEAAFKLEKNRGRILEFYGQRKDGRTFPLSLRSFTLLHHNQECQLWLL